RGSERRRVHRGRPPSPRRARALVPVLAERGPDAPGVRDPDALVDLESLPQERRGPGRVLLQEALADSLQGARFLERRAEVADDSERQVVLVTGLTGRGGQG